MSTQHPHRFGARLALASALLLAACGGAQHYPAEPTAHGGTSEPAECAPDAADCERELRARQLELSQRLQAGAEPQATAPSGPDCDAAAELRDRICALADAICALADRNPDSSELAGKCSAAQSSCAQARSDVTRGCGP